MPPELCMPGAPCALLPSCMARRPSRAPHALSAPIAALGNPLYHYNRLAGVAQLCGDLSLVLCPSNCACHMFRFEPLVGHITGPSGHPSRPRRSQCLVLTCQSTCGGRSTLVRAKSRAVCPRRRPRETAGEVRIWDQGTRHLGPS